MVYSVSNGIFTCYNTLVNNAGSGISTTSTDLCVNTTADINLGDHIKFADEFMLVTSVGIATTLYRKACVWYWNI